MRIPLMRATLAVVALCSCSRSAPTTTSIVLASDAAPPPAPPPPETPTMPTTTSMPMPTDAVANVASVASNGDDKAGGGLRPEERRELAKLSLETKALAHTSSEKSALRSITDGAPSLTQGKLDS